MCKLQSFVYTAHYVHQYSCLTLGYSWNSPCSLASAFAACDWGKVPRRNHLSQCLLVQLPLLTHLGGSWMPNDRPKEEMSGVSKTCSYAATPRHPATWRMRRATGSATSTLAKMTPGFLKHLWAVGWYIHWHQMFTIKSSRELLWDILFHKAAAQRDSATRSGLFGKGD